jgi:hypothetical protein
MGSVKCIFNGRLGNQLFQLAHAISEGIEHQVPVILGNWDALEYFPTCKTYPVETAMSKITHHEQAFHHHKQPFIPGYCNEYAGYFQTELYFEKYRDTIVAMLTPKVTLSGKMPDGVWCAVHIRRGDYLQLQGFHPSVPLDYYKRAIEIVGPVDGYIIFSDDLPWCREHLAPLLKGEVKYEDEFTNHPVEAMWCMSKCKHVIGANSSFSWWGAYLGDQTGTKVFPKPWFGPNLNGHNTKDLVPSRWQRI